MAIRNFEERKQDVLDRLEHDRDVWVATADSGGQPHLVPFSLVWDGANVIVATVARSVTTRNVEASRQVRLAIGGSTRDVVLIDAELEALVAATEVADGMAELFLKRTGWDARHTQSPYAYLTLKPVRILAWNSEEELEGRVIMSGGVWRV